MWTIPTSRHSLYPILEPPMLKRASNRTPLDDAWNWIFRGQMNQREQDRVRRLFDNDDYLDSFQQTIIHKVVLEIVDGDLESELEQNPSLIDAIDSTSRTALCWAIARNDIQAARTLLRHGADTSIGNPMSIALDPFHTTPDCLELLLQADADVNQADSLSRTPMHLIARNHNSRPFIDPLLSAGADVHRFDTLSQTPLHEACFRTHDEVVAALIDAGANINALGMHNKTPLQTALCNRFVKEASTTDTQLPSATRTRVNRIIFSLLRAKPDLSMSISDNGSILHDIAAFADVDAMALFHSTGDLKGLDAALRNSKGETPLQMLAGRRDTDPGLVQQFGRLMEQVVAANLGLADKPPSASSVGAQTGNSQTHFQTTTTGGNDEQETFQDAAAYL